MNELNNQDEVVKLLKEQQKYLKRQVSWMRFLTIFLTVTVVAVGGFIFTLIPKAEKIMTQIDTVTNDMDTVITDLNNANLPVALENVNKLLETSQTTLVDAAENMNKIDFETLNKAIGDLQKVVEPLANLFK